MKKKLSTIFCLLIGILFIVLLKIYLKLKTNLLKIIAMDFILIANIAIIIICSIVVWYIFRQYNFKKKKKFKKFISSAVARAFLYSSIASIIFAIIIYGFFGKIIKNIHIASSIQNYAILYSKIWFVATPFIGLEITIFKYFSKIESYLKPVLICILKLLIYVGLTALFYIKFPNECFVYAKPISDILFLPYYIKICLDLTYKPLENNFKEISPDEKQKVE